MRQPFRDVYLDGLIEELDHLQIRLSLVEDPDVDTWESGAELREAIADLGERIVDYRRRARGQGPSKEKPPA